MGKNIHGLRRHPLYSLWCEMRRKCSNPKHVDFDIYGGRGIKVCERWDDMKSFLEDMGEKPSPESTLGRIDNSGDYTPENCRWASIKQRNRNRRNTRYLTFRGETRSLGEFAERYGISSHNLWLRIFAYGWSVEKALIQPLGKRKSRGTNISKHPLYRMWRGMRMRCRLPSEGGRESYGGRGIKVCDRWESSFENFLADVGEKPLGCTLDRIDNDGDYSPENCRWATPKQQHRNTQCNRMIEFNGETLCISEWAERLGTSAQTVHCRLYRGWTVKDALTKRVG